MKLQFRCVFVFLVSRSISGCAVGQEDCDSREDNLPDVSLLQTGTRLKPEASAHGHGTLPSENGYESLKASSAANQSWIDDTVQQTVRGGLNDYAHASERMARVGRSWTKAWCFVALCSLYGLCCVLYETLDLRATSGHASGPGDAIAKPEKPRHEEWDLIKFTLNFCVVYTHFLEFNFAHYGVTAWFKWYMNLPAGFMMSSFAIMSGVFGQSFSRFAIARVLCYTYGTAYLCGVASEILNYVGTQAWDWQAILIKPNFPLLWYLSCLASWRLFISPLFFYGSCAGVPPILTFAVVFVLCYTGWHTTTALEPLVPKTNFFGVMLAYNSFETFTHGVFFALGHTMPLARWSSMLRDGRLIALGTAFTMAWYGALAYSERFRDWNTVACLGECGKLMEGIELNADTVQNYLCINHRHFPWAHEHGTGTLSWEMLVIDARNYLLKGSISLAVLWAIVAPLPLMRRFAPTLTRVVCRGGSRTLYSYVLHYLLVVQIADLLDFPKFYGEVPEAYVPAFAIFVALCSVLLTTSALTERLLSWMVMPFWLMDPFGCAPKAEEPGQPAAKPANEIATDIFRGDREKPPT